MTPDEKEAIRAHVAKGGNIGPVDAAALLAEVDRLTAQVKGFPFLPYVEGQNDERARILAGMEGLPEAAVGYPKDLISRAAVLRAGDQHVGEYRRAGGADEGGGETGRERGPERSEGKRFGRTAQQSLSLRHETKAGSRPGRRVSGL